MDKSNLYMDASAPIIDRVKDLLSKMTLEEKVNQLSSQMILYTEDKKRN